MATSAAKRRNRYTAVDLVTIAAMAAIFRSLIYVLEFVGFAFPFNTLILTFGWGLTALVAAMVVRKVGVFTMLTIAAQLINFFLQGEMIVAVLVLLFWGVLADLYVYIRSKAGADPFSNARDLTITTIILAVSWVGITYGIAYPFIYLLDLGIGIYTALMIGGIITILVGGWLGYGIGNRVKGLIG